MVISKTAPRARRRANVPAALGIIAAGLVVVALAGCQGTIMVTDGATVTVTPGPVPTALPVQLEKDKCFVCHQGGTPGVTHQFSLSAMAVSGGVSCTDCHETAAGYAGAASHYGTTRLAAPTPAMCQKCHEAKVAQFSQGRHSLPAYVAVHGAGGLSTQQLAMYQAIPEGSFDAARPMNTLAKLEGETIVPFACDTCHNIGQAHADGSAGRCQSCHLTHQFSLTQARKPDTCGACHIGPDHPQTEIFMESAHGIAYATLGEEWNWDTRNVTVADVPAATCATCHISAFGGVAGSHDVGERLSTYSFAPISTLRPNAQENEARMQQICKSCHGAGKIAARFDDVDKLVATVNGLVKESDAIMAGLKSKGLLTDAPFDEPIDYVYYELWHHWGRTTKFGAEMNGADYTQWHGIYELQQDLAELKALAKEKEAGK